MSDEPELTPEDMATATNDYDVKQDEDTCAGCGQPRVHPFHAPRGLFGREMVTHEFKERK